MPLDILLRLLLAVGIILLGLALASLHVRASIRRGESKLSELRPWGSVRAHVLVYFTTPSCVPCRTIQRPAIDAVKRQLGVALDVIEIDAEDQPDLARRWGILTVPTTYVFNADGEVTKVNHGAVRAEQLLEQLQAA